MKISLVKSLIAFVLFITAYSFTRAQMAPEKTTNTRMQTNPKSNIHKGAKSGKVITSESPSSDINLNQNSYPSNTIQSKNNKNKKIKSDGSVRNDYQSKPNPKGKINNLNTESLNQHPIPTRANDPSRDGVRIK